jgi:pimeloyl-ACP methyl ester carboxylesterase
LKVHINSVDIAYDDHGIGLPILFLHAFPLNRSMWSGLMTALLPEQRYRLVALDWQGLGESSIQSNQTPLTMDQLADDVAALMDRLGIQRAVLCGLSMGGYVSFAFLRKYPQRVHALILADTRPGNDTEEGKANREQLARLAETQGPDAVAELQIPKLLSEQTRQQTPEVATRVRQMIASATPAGIAAASRGMALRADSTGLLSTITCPTLVVVGEQDALTPPTIAQAYAAHIPGAQLAVLPHAGHLSNLEQPEAFLAATRTFLSTC